VELMAADYISTQNVKERIAKGALVQGSHHPRYGKDPST
jgi:hypothetical protein